MKAARYDGRAYVKQTVLEINESIAHGLHAKYSESTTDKRLRTNETSYASKTSAAPFLNYSFIIQTSKVAAV
jgi:hypothetical protein